jgi:enhancer of mRNA-decapping protein 3
MQQVHIAEVEADSFAEGLILEELEAEASPALPVVKQGKRARRRKGRKNTEDSLLEPDVMPAKETTRSKGWRQTPLLEPNPSFQPFATLKKKGRGNRPVDENGWATEDATDVQDMGDFDFAGSLAKFDKESVFTQIQAEDGIADEDRLVAHNRISKAKPGTGGGKNLHYTENVLDVPNGTPKVKAEVWKSEAGDSDMDERTSQKDTGSGRQSRRAESKLSSNRRPVSRKGSSTAASSQPQPARTLSVSNPPKFVFLK